MLKSLFRKKNTALDPTPTPEEANSLRVALSKIEVRPTWAMDETGLFAARVGYSDHRGTDWAPWVVGRYFTSQEAESAATDAANDIWRGLVQRAEQEYRGH